MINLIIFITLCIFIMGILGIKILNEYERGVIFRLGRVTGSRGPGLIFLIPGIEQIVRIDLRTVTLDVPPQDAISRDNVTIKVNAVVYFKVLEPIQAVIEVENYLIATSQLAQTTLRSVLGQIDLDELLSSRESVNQRLQTILDIQTQPWGVKVSHVEIKQIDLPLEMQRAMAKQAEAERERRAKIITAEGELQASQKLSEAAKIMSLQPMALQLRYLHTLKELASQPSSTTVIPIPMELFNKSSPFQ